MRTRHKGWIKLNLVFEDEFQVPLLMLLLSTNAVLVCTVLNKLMSSLSKRTWLLSKINRGLFHCTFNLNRPAQKISRLHIHTSEWKVTLQQYPFPSPVPPLALQWNYYYSSSKRSRSLSLVHTRGKHSTDMDAATECNSRASSLS